MTTHTPREDTEAGTTIGASAEGQGPDTIASDSGGVTSDIDSQISGERAGVGDAIENEDATGSGDSGGGSG